MAAIEDVSREFEEFAQYLRRKHEHELDTLVDLGGGFENWLKIEFVFWLAGARGLSVTPRPGEQYADVGVEYALQLDHRYRDLDRDAKRCDIWVRATQGPSELFHYVELKVPFGWTNTGKILVSGGNDLWYMASVRRSWEQAASGNLMVVGVRFDDWPKACQAISDQVCGKQATLTRSGDITKRLHWAAWTRSYR